MDQIIRGKLELENIPGQLFFGRAWESSEEEEFTKQIQDNAIPIIWNLTTQEDKSVRYCFNLACAKIWSPIEDFSVPENKDAFLEKVDQVLTALKLGTNIYVHCLGGHGRTSIALCLVLIRLGIDNKKALEMVEKLTGGPETDEQIEYVLNYFC
jgi:hypothetical protein